MPQIMEPEVGESSTIPDPLPAVSMALALALPHRRVSSFGCHEIAL